MKQHPVEIAAESVGSQNKLASMVGVTAQAISKWRRSKIPAERVLDVERASGVSRHDLRPDLYPRERRA